MLFHFRIYSTSREYEFDINDMQRQDIIFRSYSANMNPTISQHPGAIKSVD